MSAKPIAYGFHHGKTFVVHVGDCADAYGARYCERFAYRNGERGPSPVVDVIYYAPPKGFVCAECGERFKTT